MPGIALPGLGSLLLNSEISGFLGLNIVVLPLLSELLPFVTVILDIRFRFLLYTLFSFQCARGSYKKRTFCGGEYRARTCDPLRARQVLSQLS